MIDAEVEMQVSYAIDVLRSRRAAGQLGQTLVVHLGNNGAFTARQFDEMMRVLSDVDKVIVVNVRVPRAWQTPNNEAIYAGVRGHPKAELVDWCSVSAGHPEFFVTDGVDPEPPGQRLYASMISAQIEANQPLSRATPRTWRPPPRGGRPCTTRPTEEEPMADRTTKERKLLALMINDLEANLDLQDLSRAEEEVRALPDDELERTLASRLDLPYPTDEETLDAALLHVKEPEILSDSPGNLTAAPDMSHEPGPGENRDV